MSAYDELGGRYRGSPYDGVLDWECPNCGAHPGDRCTFEVDNGPVKETRFRHLPCLSRIKRRRSA